MDLKGRDTMCTGPQPEVIVPFTARCELVYSQSGQVIENVFYVRGPDAWTEQELQDLAANVEDAWRDNLRPIQSNEVTLLRVRVTDLGTNDGRGVEYAALAPAQGAVAAAVMPGSVTVAVKFATGFTGRSRRGRAYHIGLTEGQVTGNALAGDMAASIQTAWIGFFTAIEGAMTGVQHVIVSFCGNGVWRPDPLVTVVTNYSVDPYIDSQRRRLTGRGL